MKDNADASRFWVLLLVCTGAALAMRLLWLDRPSFWIDELFTVMHTSRLGDGNLTKQLGFLPTWVSLTLADALPARELALSPQTWAELGVNHTVVRMPSVIIGSAAVFLLGWLSRGVIGTQAAIWFAAFLALSVWHLHMSQTGRFYAQQMLFYNMGFLLYYRATSVGSVVKLAVSMLMLFLGFMSQPPALMLGVIIALDWAAGLRGSSASRLTRAAFVAGGVTALACAAVLFIDITSRSSEWAQFAGQISQPWHVILLGVVWLVGPVTAVLAGIGWLTLFQQDRRLALYLGMGAAIPVLIMALLGATGQFVHVRYAFVSLPAWLLLAACGVANRDWASADPIGWIRSVAPGFLALAAAALQCLGYYTAGGGFRPAWQDAFAYIEQNREPGDIVTGDNHAFWQGRYYLGDDSFVELVDDTGTPVSLWDFLGEADQRVWIVDKGGAAGTMRWSGLRTTADLRWYFERPILQPFSTIKLFVHDPDAASD